MTRQILLAGCCAVGFGCFDLESLRPGSGDGGTVPMVVDAALPDVSAVVDATSVDVGGPTPPRDASVSLDSGSVASCGIVGTSCCRPDNHCTEGVCLRGVCAAFGGIHVSANDCVADCTIRNSYTAGCSCPFGFVESVVGVRARSCSGAAIDDGALAMCTPAQWPGAGDVRAFFLSGCSGECLAPHPETGACSCPPDTSAQTVTVGVSGSCSDARGQLTFCEGSGGSATWAGLWQHDAGACSQVNSVTGTCECPEGATDQRVELPPTTFHLCLW